MIRGWAITKLMAKLRLLKQGQVITIHRDTQEAPKTRRIKVKGQFRPSSQLQAPGCALIWRSLLEGQTKACWDESYFVGLPNVSSFAGSNLFWVM